MKSKAVTGTALLLWEGGSFVQTRQEKPLAEPVTMDALVRLARVNADLIGEQKTATDTATVIARLIEGADVVFAVWATNPADPDPTHFEAVVIKGQHLLGQNIDAKVTAIGVNNEREANSLRIHLGDGHNVKKPSIT
jgi:hypothetical protein